MIRTPPLQCSNLAKTRANNDVTILLRSSCSIRNRTLADSFPRCLALKVGEPMLRGDDSCEPMLYIGKKEHLQETQTWQELSILREPSEIFMHICRIYYLQYNLVKAS